MNARALLLLLFAPASLLADVEMKYNDGSGFLVSGGRVMFADDSHAVLYEPGRKGLVVLDSTKKTWMEIDSETLGDVTSSLTDQMEQALASLPPEQRAMVEQQMPNLQKKAQAARPVFSIERTGGHHVVAGFDCNEATISGGQPGSEEIVCIASADELGISGDDYHTMIEFMDSLSRLAAMSPTDDPVIDFGALDGVPIRSENVARGEVRELVRVDTSGIDAAQLRVPDDYTEMSMGAMMRQ